MKNFTNNFKQITSRLSARWLIMALMMLVGTSSAWGAYYVAGTMNGWSTNSTDWELKNNQVTRWLNAGTYEWKITNGSWNQSWGNNENNENNISTSVSCSGPVTFKFSGSGTTPTASFNCPNKFNQSAITFYYDATNTPDVINSDKCYFMLGDDGGASRTTLSRVSGTQYLYKGSVSARNNNLGWYIFYESKDYTENIHKWCYSSHKSTCTYNSAAATNKVYKAKSTTESVLGENNTFVSRYSWESSQTTYATYKVNINSVTGGTLTVKDYDNTTISSGTSKSILTVLKFSATPLSGYELEKIDIKNSSGTVLKTIAAADLATTTYTLESAVTIDPTWNKSCEAPDEPTATVEQHTTKCNNTDREQGIITLTNYNPDYTYKLGDDEVSVSDDGKISGLAAGKYYITAVNSCTETKTTSTYDVDFTDVTPTGSVSISGNSPICSGEKATLTADVTTTNTISSYTWTKSDGSAHGGVVNGNTLTTAALIASTSYKVSATLTNSGCSKTFNATTYTVTVNTAPVKPTITTDKTKVVGNETAKISVSNPDNSLTYTLYKNGEATEEKDTSFDVTAGTYQVKATKSTNPANCKESELSDEIVISSCTPNATLLRATYNQDTDKIDLRGNLTETCDKDLYYGFLWKVKGENWNTNNAISGTGDPFNVTSTNNTGFEQSWANAVVGTTYVFTAYALDASSGNPSTYVWYYDETGIEASKCINIETPNITTAPICAGSTATLTLNNKQNGVTYTLDDNTEIFKYGTTHTVTPGKTTTYTITATSAISCVANQTETTTVEVEVYELPDAPTINEETTVCPNTPFTLPTIDGDGNWYAQAKGGNAYASTTINGITETTYYYAEAVKYGCASATRTQYTVNVHTTPVAPVISLNPATVGQDKNSVLSISNETYSPSNTKYELYKGSEKVGEMTAQTTNVSSSNVGDVIYSVKATHKECTALTSTSNEVTLKVQEAGAIIAALGDLKVDPQDPVDFVAMYVKNDGLADYTDQGATKVKGYTWQFSSDGGNNWTPCVSTATIGVTNGSDKCNNFRPSAVGKYRCKVTYDVGEQTSNVLTVTGDATTAKTFKGVTMNIPVISVNTGKGNFPTCDGLSGTASKNADVIKEKISVDVKIFNTDGTVYYDRKARMNYRGSSSLNFVKKSYAFCTAKEKTKNDKGAVDTGKENLFGLSNGVKDKDWVLYAAAADPSIMRNRLMFDTFRDMTGGWSVNSMYVELVINGEYKGVYVLMDKITANMGDKEDIEGDGRVEVEWKLDKQGNTTQEGFIVKFDKTDIVDRYENTSGDQKTFKSTYSGHDGFTTYDTQIDQRFEIEYPEKEDIEEEDLDNNKGAGEWSEVFNTIKEKFNKFEYELAKGNFTEVQKLIDYTSWADWFIITEFGKNIDGYRASNLFVYDGSKPNAKIEARPLWDQELSFDNQCPNYYAKYGANNASGFMVDKSNDEAYNNDASTPFWFTGRYTGSRGTYNGSNQTFKGLLDDPCFVAMVKTRWAKHKADALSQDKLNAKVTAYTKEMGAAKDREATFWSTRNRGTCQCSYSGSTGYEYVSFDDSKKAITEWIKNRPAGLTTAIEALKGFDLTISLTVTPDGGEITPWEAVMVKVNNPSGYDYDLNYTTNTLDKVEGVIISENNDKYTYRIPRPSTWGTGDGERAAIEYGIQAILNVSDDNLQCGTINEELTKADVTITLKDEEDDDCSIVEP